MRLYAGLDTSNYTTSAAVFNANENTVFACGRLLPVKEGALGLRQSDAVFHHTRQLPDIIEQLCGEQSGAWTAIGASEKPCEAEGSYMPCFLSGTGAARQFAAVLGIPYYGFTHQQGHIMAALYGAGRMEWMERPFLAFHVSGGTTDLLLVKPSQSSVLSCTCVAHSLDLKAGQLIDRVGGKLGLAFPAGPALEELALRAEKKYKIRPSLQDGNCHLSGIENQCYDRFGRGEKAEEIALFCLKSIEAALVAMVRSAMETYGELPLLCAGGVMSNTVLRRALESEFDAAFAPPSLSRDNAVGIALLTKLMHEGTGV